MATIDPDINRCKGCGLPLSAVDDELVADVRGFYGENIDYYHLSHAPDWIRFVHWANRRREQARWN